MFFIMHSFMLVALADISGDGWEAADTGAGWGAGACLATFTAGSSWMPSSGFSSAALALTADFSEADASGGGVAPSIAIARSFTRASSFRLRPDAFDS